MLRWGGGERIGGLLVFTFQIWVSERERERNSSNTDEDHASQKTDDGRRHDPRTEIPVDTLKVSFPQVMAGISVEALTDSG
ncbi:hypothetical protein XENORESO_007973 [Xenotaenia resolanae]|uniref:Uncharacterized protein n=1 Tax=Xenotaenia resolanae TaxID=208358 RepID=A0ABV0VVA2_9TELE